MFDISSSTVRDSEREEERVLKVERKGHLSFGRGSLEGRMIRVVTYDLSLRPRPVLHPRFLSFLSHFSLHTYFLLEKVVRKYFQTSFSNKYEKVGWLIITVNNKTFIEKEKDKTGGKEEMEIMDRNLMGI